MQTQIAIQEFGLWHTSKIAHVMHWFSIPHRRTYWVSAGITSPELCEATETCSYSNLFWCIFYISRLSELEAYDSRNLGGTGIINCNTLELRIFRLNQILTSLGRFNKLEDFFLQSSWSLICLHLLEKKYWLSHFLCFSFFKLFSLLSENRYKIYVQDARSVPCLRQNYISILFFRERSYYFKKKILSQYFPQLKWISACF